MKKIFKFKTEEQLNEFDKKYNYSGVFSGETSVWIYGEGTIKWFTIQYCGNRWCMNIIRINEKNEMFTFYPTTYNQFEKFIDDKFINP